MPARFTCEPAPFHKMQSQFGCKNCYFGFDSEIAILAPNMNRWPLKTSQQFHFGCEMAILAQNLDRRSLKASWQLHYEIAILAPNLDLGLLKPSDNYNFAVK